MTLGTEETLRIALSAGTTVSSVRRFISRAPNQNRRLRDRIRKAVEELGYGAALRVKRAEVARLEVVRDDAEGDRP